MANGEIKTKIALEGEKEYKRKLDEAYSTLRVLRSELKAETAEMGKNANAQQKATLKASNLRRQIAEQEKVVKTLAEALESATYQTETNQELIDKWATKLNNARTVLANMKTQLDDTSTAVGNFTNVVADVDGDTGNAVQGVVDLGNAIDALKGIAGTLAGTMTSAFSGMLDNVKTAVSEAWDLVSDAMAAASDWTGITEMYGGSASEVEEYFKTAQIAGFDSSTVVNAMNKLITQTHNGDKDMAKLLKQWGIEEKNYTNHWDYFTAVWERLQAEAKERPNKALQYAATLFGDKNGANINGLINNWADANEKYIDRFQGSGITMDDDEIAKMNELNQQVTAIMEFWNTLRESAGLQIALSINANEGAEQILDLLTDVGRLFTGTGNSEEVKKSLQLNVEGIIDWTQSGLSSLSDWFSEIEQTLKESDNDTIKNIGDLFGTIAKLLEWISSNSELITKALNMWVNFKIADLETKLATGLGISEWISTLKEIGGNVVTLVGIAKLTGAGKTFMNSAGAAAPAATAASSAIPAWLTNLGGNAAMVGQGMLSFFSMGGGLVGDWFNQNIIQPIMDGTIDEKAQEKVEEIKESFDDSLASYERVAGAYADWRHNVLAQPIDAALEWIGNLFTGTGTPKESPVVGNFGWYDDEFGYNNEGFGQTIADAVRIGLIDEQDAQAHGYIADAERQMQQAMDSVESRASTMFTSIIDSVSNSISNVRVYLDGHEVGVMVAPYVDVALGDGMR